MAAACATHGFMMPPRYMQLNSSNNSHSIWVPIKTYLMTLAPEYGLMQILTLSMHDAYMLQAGMSSFTPEELFLLSMGHTPTPSYAVRMERLRPKPHLASHFSSRKRR
jgi:hypothetical protein